MESLSRPQSERCTWLALEEGPWNGLRERGVLPCPQGGKEGAAAQPPLYGNFTF